MNSIVLIGAEDVRSAGYTIQSAAADMKQAVINLEGVLFQHQRFMDDWLQRFEYILEQKGKSDGNIPL